MFDRIVLINLDKRPDRLGAFKAKISPYPFLHNYTRYRAIHGDTVTVPPHFISGGGAWGCRQSHLRVLEDALLDGVESVLVFEDDVRFVPNFEIKLKRFMSAVPDDWEGLMLGGQNHASPIPTDIDGVFKSVNTQRTHAYVVRGKEPMQDLYRLWARCDRHIDHWFGQWQTRHQVYQPNAFFCGQDETSSDISGRNDTVRFWGSNTPEASDTPITVLISDRATAEILRNIGFHYGNDRDKLTGKDNGLLLLESINWPADRLSEWGKLIVMEAAEQGDVPGMWHNPVPDAKFLEERLGRKVVMIEARTAEEAVQKIPKLIPAWRASRIIWCWRGEGYEILEGMAYHGWHRGNWKDDVTGLDQGIRHMIDKNKPHLVKQIVRQLEREIVNIKYGKILLAHPRLDVDAVRRELPDYTIHEIIGRDIAELIEHTGRIIHDTTEMYRDEGDQ